MKPFRVLGWRIFYFGMTVGVLGLGASLVSQRHYINAISVGLPAAFVGASMFMWPGSATSSDSELVLSRDWETMWTTTRTRDKLVWLLALSLGVVFMMGMIMAINISADR